MKSFDIKIEKTNSISRFQRLQKVTTLFRFVEMFIFLIMISGSSSQFPSAIKVSYDYFREIAFTLLNPKFVFVIGNVIILILFLKSRVVENDDISNEKTDLCYDYVTIATPVTPTPVSASAPISTRVIVSNNKRKIRRSRSEDPKIVKCENNKTRRELRRCLTNISTSEDPGMMEKSCVKDELSCEDFRRTVDGFIARQQKMLRDEEFAPMVYIGS